MWKSFGRGVEIAVRSSAAPWILGARLARPRVAHGGVPAPGAGLGIATKVALDEFFFATEAIRATFVPLRDRRRLSREVARATRLYRERGWLSRPARYHRKPPPLRDARLDVRQGPFVAHRHLTFESGYAPHPGEPGRRRWLGYTATHTAHARLLEHPDGQRPWLVCVPGYRMGHAAVDFTGFRARWLHHTLGLNVAIPVLPLHGPRRVGRSGGDGFFSGDFLDTVHAQAQAVWDVRRLIGWLRDRGAPGVGVYGVSLGGYTAALTASLDPGLDCVIAGIPAADFPRLLRAHVPSVALRAATRAGYPIDASEAILRVISPLALAPRVPHARRFLYAGAADRLTSPDHARDLWLHWGRPRMEWYAGGHVSFLWESTVPALLTEALAASGLLDASAPRAADAA